MTPPSNNKATGHFSSLPQSELAFRASQFLWIFAALTLLTVLMIKVFGPRIDKEIKFLIWSWWIMCLPYPIFECIKKNLWGYIWATIIGLVMVAVLVMTVNHKYQVHKKESYRKGQYQTEPKRERQDDPYENARR